MVGLVGWFVGRQIGELVIWFAIYACMHACIMINESSSCVLSDHSSPESFALEPFQPGNKYDELTIDLDLVDKLHDLGACWD